MLSDPEIMEKKSNQTVKAAVKAGADAADALIASGLSLQVKVRNGKVEENLRSESVTLTLRVFVGKRVASIATNQIEKLDDLIDRAVAMAKVAPEDEFAGLADKNSLATEIKQLDLYDNSTLSTNGLIERAKAAEDSGLSVKGVEKSGGATATWYQSGTVFSTSHGFSGSYQKSSHGISMTAIAGKGTNMESDNEYDIRTHLEDLNPPSSVGLRAGERAVQRLNPKKVESLTGNVVYEPRTARSLIGHFLSAINGSAVAKGTSFLKDMQYKQLFPNAFRIVDEPHKPKGLGSRPFDGEGVSMDQLVLADKGILCSWLLDSSTARELGLKTNGRALRGSTGPMPTSTNVIVEPGSDSPEEIMEHFGSGLLVTDLIGHGVNGVTGDYSRGASGFWFENGQIAYPVSEITIAGNLMDMYTNMSAANDFDGRFSICTPTLAVEGMTIGGK